MFDPGEIFVNIMPRAKECLKQCTFGYLCYPKTDQIPILELSSSSNTILEILLFVTLRFIDHSHILSRKGTIFRSKIHRKPKITYVMQCVVWITNRNAKFVIRPKMDSTLNISPFEKSKSRRFLSNPLKLPKRSIKQWFDNKINEAGFYGKCVCDFLVRDFL